MHNSCGLPSSPPGSVRGRPPARSSRLPTATAGPGASPLRAAGERGEPQGCPGPRPGPQGRCVPTAGRGRVVRRGQRGGETEPLRGAGGATAATHREGLQPPALPSCLWERLRQMHRGEEGCSELPGGGGGGRGSRGEARRRRAEGGAAAAPAPGTRWRWRRSPLREGRPKMSDGPAPRLLMRRAQWACAGRPHMCAGTAPERDPRPPPPGKSGGRTPGTGPGAGAPLGTRTGGSGSGASPGARPPEGEGSSPGPRGRRWGAPAQAARGGFLRSAALFLGGFQPKMQPLARGWRWGGLGVKRAPEVLRRDGVARLWLRRRMEELGLQMEHTIQKPLGPLLIMWISVYY